MKRERGVVAVLWLLFWLRAAFYATVIPLWEGYDEYSHFDYLQYLALEGGLPTSATPMGRETEESLRLVPLPWTQKDYLRQIPHLVHDDFWRLPPEDRSVRELKLRALPPQQAGEPRTGLERIYESQQPPLFYAAIAPAYRVIRGEPLPERVWLLRLLCITIASLVVPLTYSLAREVLGDAGSAAGVVCVMASMPELMINVARISNEAAAVPVGTLLALATLKFTREPSSLRWSGLVGLVLSAALLTKAYFLSSLAVFGSICFVLLWRTRGRLARGISLALAVILLSAGWWYAGTWQRTGSLSGEQHDAALRNVSVAEILVKIPQVHWREAADSTFVSHIWFGGWSFLKVRSWMYRVFAVAALLACAGLVISLVKCRSRNIAILLGYYVALLCALAYHVLITFVSQNVSATTGWYLYGLAGVECVLVVVGLKQLLPSRRHWYVAPAMTFAFLALELFATHVYLLPYYAGFIMHNQSGALPAMPFSRLLAELPEVLARLTMNKPAVATTVVMTALWLCYLIASLLMLVVSFRSREACSKRMDELG